MDENTIRQRAREHGEATVAGDLKRAGADLDKSAYSAAGEVMKQMPDDLSSCEVASVREDGEEWVAAIRYRGASDSTTVESRWAERDGNPKIVDLNVV